MPSVTCRNQCPLWVISGHTTSPRYVRFTPSHGRWGGASTSASNFQFPRYPQGEGTRQEGQLSDDDGWLCSGDTLLVTKLDRLARSTPDLYRIVSQLTEWGVVFKVVDDPSIDTSTRTGKLITGILALIAEFENDIRRERQQDGINKAKAEGVRFGPKPLLTLEVVRKIKELRSDGAAVPEIMRRTKLSKASVYRALNA
jgi:hypothetical protein